MEPLRLDHVVIHVTDWSSTVAFYRAVLGAVPVPNEEGAANPLGAFALRLGCQQINVHGPWPRREPGFCCPPPLNQPGTADLCFEWQGSVDSAAAHLAEHGAPVAEGPIRRFGSRGWGISLYILDPSGNSIELICYTAG